MRKALLAATVVCLISQAVAMADTKGLIDRDDSVGPLDIAAVQHGHEGSKLTFEIATYESWESDVLSSGGLLISISLDRDKHAERGISIHPDENGDLVARVFGRGGEIDGFRGYADVARPDEHSVTVTFRRALLKRNLAEVWWRAESSYQASGDPCDGEAGGCIDFAPKQNRYIKHDL